MIELDEFAISRNEWIKLFFRQILKPCCKSFAYCIVLAIAFVIFANDWFVSLVVFPFIWLTVGFIIGWYQ